MRGRSIRVGGQAVDAGAAGRTDASQQTKPAFAFTAGWRIPVGKVGGTSVGGGETHPLLDLGSVSFWRFFWAGLALAYVIGFHVQLNGARLGIGPARG